MSESRKVNLGQGIYCGKSATKNIMNRIPSTSISLRRVSNYRDQAEVFGMGLMNVMGTQQTKTIMTRKGGALTESIDYRDLLSVSQGPDCDSGPTLSASRDGSFQLNAWGWRIDPKLLAGRHGVHTKRVRSILVTTREVPPGVPGDVDLLTKQ